MFKEHTVTELRQRLLSIARALELEYTEKWINELTKEEVISRLNNLQRTFRK